jgi:hypothetical protein
VVWRGTQLAACNRISNNRDSKGMKEELATEISEIIRESELFERNLVR